MNNRIVIATASGSSMVGSWDHSLYCTFCANNSISLRLEMRGDAPTYRPKGVRHIKTGKQFVDAVTEVCVGSSLVDKIDWESVCEEIRKRRPDLASELEDFVFESEPSEVPQAIIISIDSILNSSQIYPHSIYNLGDRRRVYEATRVALEDYYRNHDRLPEKTFTVNGFTFDIETSGK